MRIPRIYQAVELIPGQTVELDSRATHHIVNVLRLKQEAPLILFNGQGGDYEASLTLLNRRNAAAHIINLIPRDTESPLQIHLGQAISRGEKMDFTIQKAVELGVTYITPILGDRCEWVTEETRIQKRILHWQSVAISASEQCGRNKIVTIPPPLPLDKWFELAHTGHRLVLHHRAQQSLATLSPPVNNLISLMIGPEGGWSESEIEQAENRGFISIQLGPRILRTETAALAALTALQYCFGDLK
jgi:16S rRNA (uracil1498-N3)-methyltransferase